MWGLALVATAILGTSIWRASEQAITHDEALTYLKWVDQPWSQLQRGYTANNHVLHTVLAKLASEALGPSPFSLRLTAVASGAVFLALLLVLARGAWGAGAAAVLGFASLAFHPVLLDAFACARGYGPASAALLGAVVHVQRLLTAPGPPRRRSLVGLGVLLAIVVGFNLAFAFAALGLGATFALLVTRLHPRAGAWRAVLLYAGLPALIVAGAVLGPILADARRERFHYGAQSWSSAFLGWYPQWLRHTVFGMDTSRVVTPIDEFVQGWGALLLAAVLAIALIGALGALRLVSATATRLGRGDARQAGTVARPSPTVAGQPAHRGAPSPHAATAAHVGALQPASVLFATCGLACALTVLASTLSHEWFDLPLPHRRTALPIAILAGLAAPSALAAIRARTPWARIAAGGIGLLLATIVVLEQAVFPARTFAEWSYDAGSERVHRELERLAPPDRPLAVVSLPFLFAPAQNYYRALRDADWMLEVDLRLVPGRRYDLALVPSFHTQSPDLAPLIGAVLYQDPISHCCIVRMLP